MADEVVPLVENNGGYFDTELLIIAEKNGYSISELPVKWSDDLDSRVNVVSTAVEDIRGLLRMRFGGLRRASRRLAALRGPSCDPFQLLGGYPCNLCDYRVNIACPKATNIVRMSES